MGMVGWGLQREAQPHIHRDGLSIITSLSSTQRGGRTGGSIPIKQIGTPRLREEKMCSLSHSKAVTEQVAELGSQTVGSGQGPCVTRGETETERRARTRSRSPSQ